MDSTSSSSSEIDWSQFPKPLPSGLFDKYTHQSIAPPLTNLDIDETHWNECRSFALQCARKGFLDPLSILYTSFKRLYPPCASIRSFARWLALYEKDCDDFQGYFKQYSVHSMNIQSTGELIRFIETLEIPSNIDQTASNFDQIWFLFSISIRIPVNDYAIIADTLILDDGVTRLSVKNRKHSSSYRIHCLFALTPSGKFSNQVIVCKHGKYLKMNFQSSAFTRIIQTPTGDVTYEHVQQWFDDFISLSYGKNQSAILVDPRTTLLTPDMSQLCAQSSIELITLDLNYYLIHILCPIFTLFDRQCSEVNRLDKMFLKSASDFKRIIFTIWCSLRTLKQNEQICQLFHESFLWTKEDEFYRQSLRVSLPTVLPKKKKKKSPMKTGTKMKISVSSTPIIDPPSESTPEEIFSYFLQRQLSISRASKFFGGMKLDYLKYCLSNKSPSCILTGAHLVQLNHFMQSPSTIDWLRELRALYYWPCAKPLFLREIYQLTGLITRKRTINLGHNGNLGSIRTCDLQSPAIFWQAFEDLHQIQFDHESIMEDEQWQDDFQQYLIEHQLHHEQTELWTIDTFEFPLIKKSSVLQLPEWNESRPMNLTPKVTVIYAFSNMGQSIPPCFIFPTTFHDPTSSTDDDFYDQLGHLTPQIFLRWIEKYFQKQIHSPVLLLFCSRLPVLSSSVLSSLKTSRIFPFGYPYARTLPFRYLFERRVRNNRSTNLISELWKKKLLDEQRTHVLKGVHCTVTMIKYYFEQIWLQIFHEDEELGEPVKSFEEKCRQAFEQANIGIKRTAIKRKSSMKLPTKKINLSNDHQQLVDQLNHLLNIINNCREQITSTNSTPILKMNNHIDGQPISTSSESDLTVSSSSSNSDKRAIDENAQPSLTKRLRSSYSQSNNSLTTNTVLKWIPPSKQLVRRLQSQSSSLLQFISSLLEIILPSIDHPLTDEHSHWLHSTINSSDYEYNHEKIDLLITTAYRASKSAH